jgi:cell wall-associated NlpC family hydrolase
MRPAQLRILWFSLLVAFCGAPGWAKDPVCYVVLRPVINFHSGPREDTDVVSQALLGARLLELEQKDGWVRVKGDDDYPGWAQRSSLRELNGSEQYPASMEAGQGVEVEALGANIYLEPDVTKHAPVMTVPYGARLERVNGGRDTQRWLEIRLPDRRVAWIQWGDVRLDSRPISIEDSLTLARRFLGSTYTWGGSSTFGFDCSGFTQTIIRRRGRIMPRNANIQAAWSGLATVATSADLQPGDLLFFGRDPAHITHTGMFLGKGTFIHDTPRDHPGVQVSELSDPYWAKLLVAMRRLK